MQGTDQGRLSTRVSVATSLSGLDDFSAQHVALRLPCRIACMMYASRALGLSAGVLLGVPIPQDAAAEGALVERAITQALEDAAREGVKGNEVSNRGQLFLALFLDVDTTSNR